MKHLGAALRNARFVNDTLRAAMAEHPTLGPGVTVAEGEADHKIALVCRLLQGNLKGALPCLLLNDRDLLLRECPPGTMVGGCVCGGSRASPTHPATPTPAPPPPMFSADGH